MSQGIRIRTKQSIGLSALVVLASCTTGDVADTAALQTQARDIAGQFTSTLLPTLQNALAEGWPENAIEVCSVRAPEIADELAAATNWSVRRVSLKARNSELAIPDSWEREVLEEFENRELASAPMTQSAVVDGEYRYMQAQLAMPLCLSCHGQNLSPEVSAALRQHYPNDLATGYREGDVRGAISLRYSLD